MDRTDAETDWPLDIERTSGRPDSSKVIDLFSDSQTRPTEGMRQAMARAVVGDEQADEDPSTLELCASVAEMLGMEAGVLLPSGTMCNLVAVLALTNPGDEVICDESSHIYCTEAAGSAAIAGVSIRPITSRYGVFDSVDVLRALRSPSRTAPRSRLLSIEQPTNFTGGAVWPLSQLRAVRDIAQHHGLATHLDGARILNAVAATGVTASTFAQGWDSAWLDLTKGLGCPVGAVLCGTRELVQTFWQWKYRLGGAMRQSGVLAAAGLHALEHHVGQAAIDNQNASALHQRLVSRSEFVFDPLKPETNILRFEVLGVRADALVQACLARGVRVRAIDHRYLRAVCHQDVNSNEVEQAADALIDAVATLLGTA